MNRLEEFASAYFPGKADAIMITSGVNRQYLLHFHSSAGTLLILPEKQYFIIDFRYYEKAQRQITGCELILQDRLYEQIREILKRHHVHTVGLEDNRVTLQEFSIYQKMLPEVSFISNCGVYPLLDEMRRIKSADEIEKIDQAQQITDEAFTRILNYIKPGVTEKQIALELEYSMKKQGADGIAFETIAVSGKNSALPHGEPSDKPVERGDFITMDFGAVVDGYHADMTRTIVVGSISDEQKRVYDTVLQAQLMALEQIAVGKSCSEIDVIARSYIDEMGYQGCFGHGLGHGVGLEIHEEPRFSPACDVILKPGMVLSVEPGIYLSEKFGVRIEDLIVVEEKGIRNFTKSDKNLICL